MEEAEALLRECMQSHPDCAVAYNNLARTLIELNRPDEAIADVK